MDKPICWAMTGSSTNASMTDPKNPGAQNEELNLEQLEDAAGGVGGTSGPGGTSFPKTGITPGPELDQ